MATPEPAKRDAHLVVPLSTRNFLNEAFSMEESDVLSLTLRLKLR
jgi:hypothetical protein